MHWPGVGWPRVRIVSTAPHRHRPWRTPTQPQAAPPISSHKCHALSPSSVFLPRFLQPAMSSHRRESRPRHHFPAIFHCTSRPLSCPAISITHPAPHAITTCIFCLKTIALGHRRRQRPRRRHLRGEQSQARHTSQPPLIVLRHGRYRLRNPCGCWRQSLRYGDDGGDIPRLSVLSNLLDVRDA